MANAATCGAHRLEHTDGARTFKDKNQQAANHREACHAHHQHKDDPHIEVEHFEPRKSGGRVGMLLHGEGRIDRAVAVCLSIYLLAYQRLYVVKVREIVHVDFQHTALVLRPVVELSQSGDIRQHKVAVEVRHVGIVDAYDLQTAHLDGLLKEIGIYLLSHLQPKVLGLHLRDNNLVAHLVSLPLWNASLHHLLAHESQVVFWPYAFQANGLVGTVGLEDAHLLRHALHVLHARRLLDLLQQLCVRHDGITLGRGERTVVENHQVRTESRQFVADFLLETFDNRYTNNHNGQPQGYPSGSDANGQFTGAAFAVAGSTLIESSG